MKKVFLLALLMLITTSAYATEYVVDTGFDNPSNLTVGTGCAYSASQLVVTAAIGKCAFKGGVAVKKGDHVKYSITISSYTSGALQVVASGGAAVNTGANVPVTDGANGQTAIQDNFDSNLGLQAGVVEPIDNSTEDVGAFRFSCSAKPKYIADDPMVYHGQPGVSHVHLEIGNNSFGANSTEISLRTSGGSNCGSNRYPIQRSAYWTPTMENGSGDMVDPFFQNIYYKQLPNGNAACGFPDATHLGICVPLPRSLRYLMGFNMATMTGGPTSADPTEALHFGWECRQRNDQGTRDVVANGSYKTIDAVVAAGCPAGGILYEFLEGMSCWDGLHVDTVNHRDHMAWPNGPNITVHWTIFGVPQADSSGPACPTDHPYKIPTFAWALYFVTDADFAAGKWHLSSDDGMGMISGTTLHMDYWASWSPYFQNLWATHCINEHRTCSAGSDGIGQQFGGSPGTTGDLAKVSTTSITSVGRSRRLSSNGTFTGEIVAAADGYITLFLPVSSTMHLDNWSMNSVTQNNSANTTVHTTTK